MRKRVTAFLWVALMVFVVSGLATKMPSISSNPGFNEMLELAKLADAQYDQAGEPEWQEIEPQSRGEFVDLVRTIVYQLEEEGILNSRLPTDAGFVEYGTVTRSMIAGTYSPESGVVMLNARYLTDPAWRNSYLWTLVHELVHAQGFHNEAQTDTIAAEVVAALANLGYPGALTEFWDSIRRDALSLAYYIIAYEGSLVHSTDPNNYEGICLTDCDLGEPSPQDLAVWQQARDDIFTAAELRRSDKRVRFWEDPLHIATYRFVLVNYVARPMTALLEVACADDPVLDESYNREVRVSLGGGLVGKVHRPQLPLEIDDVAYLFREAGAC